MNGGHVITVHLYSVVSSVVGPQPPKKRTCGSRAFLPRPEEAVAKGCPAELDGFPRHENSSTYKTESFRFVPFATASEGPGLTRFPINLLALVPMLSDQLLLGVLNLGLLAIPAERAQQRLRDAALR